MARLVVDHSLLQDSAATTASVAREITDARTRLAQRADRLTTSGWTGPAADTFATAMSEWDAGAAEVLDALHTMADLIARANTGYARTDAADSAHVARAGARLNMD